MMRTQIFAHNATNIGISLYGWKVESRYGKKNLGRDFESRAIARRGLNQLLCIEREWFRSRKRAISAIREDLVCLDSDRTSTPSSGESLRYHNARYQT